MEKVALIILFNHNFEDNLHKLDLIYENRFSTIYYIMPFYNGKRQDVITVYENSYYFQGYIVKAIEQIKIKFQHYLIIGDDLLLNPEINENNYQLFFNLDLDSSFIPSPFLLTDTKIKEPDRTFAPFWHHLYSAINFELNKPGVEVKKFLPTIDEATKILKAHKFNFTKKIPKQMFYRNPILKFSLNKKENLRNLMNLNLIFRKNLKYLIKPVYLKYPLIGSYSDCIIISNCCIEKFLYYCGIFTALELFVEIAIPTALYFSTSKVITENDLKYKGIKMWENTDISDFAQTYNHSLENVYNGFPKDTLYVHPVKLSKFN